MPKILIVDDDADFVLATRIVLEKHSYEIITASGGNAGISLIKAGMPDLVILDVMMDSVLDGLSVSRRMHADPQLSKIPVVMVSSVANTDFAELFPTDDTIPMRAFLSKPISPEELVQTVRDILDRKLKDE
jgi:CheY-like chemotaxis protein